MFFSTVMLNGPLLLLTIGLEPIYELDLPTYESELDSPPPAKCSKHAYHNQIMAPPTDSWNKEDFIDIYGLSRNEDDGFPWICLSVSIPLYTHMTHQWQHLHPQLVVILVFVVVYVPAMKIIATA